MSEVTRYDLNEDVGTGELFISPVPQSMEGQYVSYQDYTELKAQRDALAAENARMKKAIKRIFPEGVADEKGGIGFSDAAKECYASATETPATDAYLNSVRADGVEMAASDLFESTAIGHGMLMAFAAQLRAGEPS